LFSNLYFQPEGALVYENFNPHNAFIACGRGCGLSYFFASHGRQEIEKGDIPHGTYDITVWTSDARGTAYVLIDPSGNIPVTVGGSLG
jgi:hypothetical protein